MPKNISSMLRLPRELRFRIEKGQIMARPSPGLGDFVAGVEILELLRLIDEQTAKPEQLLTCWTKALRHALSSLPTPAEFKGLLADLTTSGLVLEQTSGTTPHQRGEGRFADGWIQWAMLADDTRLELYDAAIKKCLSKGVIALDVGAGTGVLSHLLTRAGASHVYAIEETALADDIAALFRKLNKGKHASQLTVLPLPAADAAPSLASKGIGLVVSELFGNDPFCEGMLPTLRAVQKVLPRNTRSIPQRVRVKCQFAQITPQALKTGGAAGWAQRLMCWNQMQAPHPTKDNLSFDAFRRAYWASEDWSTLSFAHPLRSDDFKRVGGTALVMELDLAPVPPQSETLRTRTSTLRAPPLNDSGFLMMWFEADLCDGVTLTTLPGQPGWCSHWSPIVLPLTSQPREGLPVTLEATMDDDECHLGLVVTSEKRRVAAR
jgi:hypothetical protein